MLYLNRRKDCDYKQLMDEIVAQTRFAVNAVQGAWVSIGTVAAYDEEWDARLAPVIPPAVEVYKTIEQIFLYPYASHRSTH